jgi:catechol 2,3-dioxygenase-like lactoylglutathione lyase family enzyme
MRNLPAAPVFLEVLHEALPVRNVTATVKFYTEVLGFEQLPSPPQLGGGAFLRSGRFLVHLIPDPEYRQPYEGLKREVRHTALRVSDLDAMIKRLEGLGVPHIVGGQLGNDRVFVPDLDGHMWELQPPADSAASA